MKTFPLLYPVSGWFIGSLAAFCFGYHFYFLGIVLAGIFICSILLLLARVFSVKLLRLLTVTTFSVLSGSVYFHINDYRFQSVPENAEVYIVRVIEGKAIGFDTQQLKVRVLHSENKGRLGETSFDMIMSVSGAETAYAADDVLAVSAQLEAIENRHNPGEFDAEWYYLTKGIRFRTFVNAFDVEKVKFEPTIGGTFVRWREYLSNLMAGHLDGDFLGVAQALLLGDKDNLTDDVMRSFSNTGAMHVLAVSGLHVGLILLVLNAILSKFSRFVSKKNALLFSILLIWVYGFVTGASPAVMRAVFMFSVVAIGDLTGRKSSGTISLCVSAIVLSAIDPWVIFDIGFQLSFLAMLGVFLLYPKIRGLVEVKNKYLLWFWDGNAVGLAATAFTTPLTLFYFYQFPNYFLLANVGVMVFGFLVLLAGIIFLASSPIPVISSLVAILFCFTILGLLLWVGWVEKLPGSVSGGFHLTLLELMIGLGLVMCFALSKTRKWNNYLWLGVAAIVVVISFNRMQEMEKQQVILLNANELVMVIKTDQGTVGLYTPRFGHAVKVPRSLEDYQRYSGLEMKTYAIETGCNLKVGENNVRIEKKRFGLQVRLNDKKFFYQTYGNPKRGKNIILNAKLREFVDPDAVPQILSFKL